MQNLDTLLECSQKVRVLYIEDNKTARESTFGLLQNIFKNVTVAVDGEDGLRQFIDNTTAYDLIISDINMPNMDGRELVKKIREIDTDIKIFILSAYSELESNLIEQIEAYLFKPIDFTHLLQEVQKHFADL